MNRSYQSLINSLDYSPVTILFTNNIILMIISIIESVIGWMSLAKEQCYTYHN